MIAWLRWRVAMFLLRCAEMLAHVEPSHEENDALH